MIELWQMVSRRKEREFSSYSGIAEVVGCSAPTIQRIVSSKMKDGKSLHPDTKTGLLRWLGEPVRPLLGNLDEQEFSDDELERPSDAIPLVNKFPAAYGKAMTDKGYPEYWADDWIERGVPQDAKAYIVDGDSMEPEFRIGDICIVSPSMGVQDGMACLVQLGPEHRDENMLRYVQIDANRNVILRPANPRLPIKIVDGNHVAYIWPVTEIRRKPEWIWK